MWKKSLAGIAIAALLLAAAAPFVAQAADPAGPKMRLERQAKPSPAVVADRLTELFGVDRETVLKYYLDGVSLRDIGKASFLAKAANKPLEDVFAMKKPGENWRQTAKNLGITRKDVRRTIQTTIADQFQTKLGLDRQRTLDYLENGYRPRDVAAAGLLARDTGKTQDEVLNLKKINNTWREVAQSLGVSDETLKKQRQEVHAAFPAVRQFAGQMKHRRANW